MEPDEKMVDGAKRELEEETGLKGEVEFANLSNDDEKRENPYLHVGFLAKNIQGEPKLMEPERFYEWRWFPLDDLPENIFIGHRKQVKAFLSKEILSA